MGGFGVTPAEHVATVRCESTSPIAKFDEGPRRCRGIKGHKGDHHAKTSDGRYIEPQYDYEDTWNDEGQWTS